MKVRDIVTLTEQGWGAIAAGLAKNIGIQTLAKFDPALGTALGQAKVAYDPAELKATADKVSVGLAKQWSLAVQKMIADAQKTVSASDPSRVATYADVPDNQKFKALDAMINSTLQRINPKIKDYKNLSTMMPSVESQKAASDLIAKVNAFRNYYIIKKAPDKTNAKIIQVIWKNLARSIVSVAQQAQLSTGDQKEQEIRYDRAKKQFSINGKPLDQSDPAQVAMVNQWVQDNLGYSR